jgi:hypothetical protein
MPRLLPERFRVECIREFDLAADERHADAIRLAESGRRTGAIYLFGYVAEMLLKSAYLRLAGHYPDDPITPAILWGYVGTRPASTARALGLPGTTNLHDLGAWAALIVAHRSARPPGYPDPRFAAALTANVRVLDGRWTEVIRYHGNLAYQHELNCIRTSCGWLLANRHRL